MEEITKLHKIIRFFIIRGTYKRKIKLLLLYILVGTACRTVLQTTLWSFINLFIVNEYVSRNLKDGLAEPLNHAERVVRVNAAMRPNPFFLRRVALSVRVAHWQPP